MGYPVFYNGVNLDDIPNVEIDRRDPNQMPERVIISEKIARADGEKVLKTNWGTKTIYVSGHIHAPNKAEYEMARNLLTMYLSPREATLDIEQGGEFVTWVATMSKMRVDHIQAGLTTFELEFIASDPFGSATTSTQITTTGAHGFQAAVYTLTFEGTWNVEPIITLAIGAVTGGGPDKNIQLSNPATGEAIRVDRTWSVNDEMTVNTRDKSVTVNGSPFNYGGVFPVWGPGVQRIRVADTFTTRQITMSGVYNKRYI